MNYFWELNFFKLIGYDLELNKIVNKEFKNGIYQYYVSNSKKKYIPAFLIENNKMKKIYYKF